MKKTCMNCSHFHGCLIEGEDSYYHIHNYCDAWDKTNICPMYSIINNFLDDGDVSLSQEELPEGLGLGIYDDIETGDASCYRFEPAEEQRDDEWFKNNFEQNKKLALIALEKILRINTIILAQTDENENIVYKDWPLSADLRPEYEKLYEEIKNIEFGD